MKQVSQESVYSRYDKEAAVSQVQQAANSPLTCAATANLMVRSPSRHVHSVCTYKYMSYMMWPRVLSECIECVQLAGKKEKKIFRFVLFKRVSLFSYLFILIQEKTSKFSQTVAVSFGYRNNLIKASPFKREGGGRRGRKKTHLRHR